MSYWRTVSVFRSVPQNSLIRNSINRKARTSWQMWSWF